MSDGSKGQRDAAPDTQARGQGPEQAPPADPRVEGLVAAGKPDYASQLNAELAARRHREKELKNERDSLKARLAELESSQESAKQQQLAEQGKWQEVAEARAKEAERIASERDALRQEIRDARLRAALRRDLSREGRGVSGERAELLIDAVLPRLKVEWTADDQPQGDWDEILDAKIQAAGWAPADPAPAPKPREIQLSQLQSATADSQRATILSPAEWKRALARTLSG